MSKKYNSPAPKMGADERTINADYVKTFNTSHGRRVLDHIEKRAYSAFRLDQHPTEEKPNPAYLNPEAALYRSAQIDVVWRIRRILKSFGPEGELPNPIKPTNIEG